MEAGGQELFSYRFPVGTVWQLGWRFLSAAIVRALASDEIEPFDNSYGQAVTGQLGFGQDDESTVVSKYTMHSRQGTAVQQEFSGKGDQNGIK